MVALPEFAPGHSALVAVDGDAEAFRMVVDLVQDDHITLASTHGDVLPRDWREHETLSLTYLDRFSVYTFEVPVVSFGTTRLVIGTPEAGVAIQRRQYARVLTPLPATCLLLDGATNQFTPFDAIVRDLGGGGLALTAPAIAPAGATMVVSLGLPDEAPVIVLGTVLPSDAGIGTRITVRIEFTLVKEMDRDRILRFVLLSLAGVRHRVVPT
ncbi:MAG: PilZ domain-containing protein [Actinomycetota bacterium]